MNSLADGVSPSEAKQLRDQVREMFYHAFDGYMHHAFPLDELRPLTCKGEDTLGGYALTLIDSLDTLALLGDREQFGAAVEWVGKNVRFDIDKTVSVFETTIRILGGLLSAHLIASDFATGMKLQSYDDELLHLAQDLAQRLLPVFDSPTGIPFGSVNLLRGVDENESKITSTAGGGTLTLEFGVLSRLTNNPSKYTTLAHLPCGFVPSNRLPMFHERGLLPVIAFPVFEEVTKNAARGIWAQRSKINLVGAHINVFTGEWTQKDAGIGTSIDSFNEYLLKANNLLVTNGSCFLHEYMIPRNNSSLCFYDTRSLSTCKSDNFSMLNSWMTQGVTHGQMVIRDSDTVLMREKIRTMARQQRIFPCQKRFVNFVIFVVDGVSVLKSMDNKDPEYNEMLIESFNYPYLSFKDDKPVVVVTHGDELSFHDRARVRTHLGDILGIPPSTQIFDIPDSSDYNTQLVIVDMLRYSIEHADRNLPYNRDRMLQAQRLLWRKMEKFQLDDWVMLSEILIIFVCLIFCYFRLTTWLMKP